MTGQPTNERPLEAPAAEPVTFRIRIANNSFLVADSLGNDFSTRLGTLNVTCNGAKQIVDQAKAVIFANAIGEQAKQWNAAAKASVDAAQAKLGIKEAGKNGGGAKGILADTIKSALIDAIPGIRRVKSFDGTWEVDPSANPLPKICAKGQEIGLFE